MTPVMLVSVIMAIDSYFYVLVPILVIVISLVYWRSKQGKVPGIKLNKKSGSQLNKEKKKRRRKAKSNRKQSRKNR